MKRTIRASALRVGGSSACLAGAVLVGCLTGEVAAHRTTVPEQRDSASQRGYPTNENGMTFGSDFGKTVSPDLVAATGDDGTLGYVKREDVYGPDDVTLEDVQLQMSQQRNRSRTIPLYAQDGETVVGSFTLSPSS